MKKKRVYDTFPNFTFSASTDVGRVADLYGQPARERGGDDGLLPCFWYCQYLGKGITDCPIDSIVSVKKKKGKK